MSKHESSCGHQSLMEKYGPGNYKGNFYCKLKQGPCQPLDAQDYKNRESLSLNDARYSNCPLAAKLDD